MEKISAEQFEKFKSFIYSNYGIFLKNDKKEMIETKLSRLLLKHKFSNYEDYYNALILRKNDALLTEFANEITINKTDFFREINHFHYIKNKMDFIIENNKRIVKNNEIRVWSSAASTGEEPYSIAITLNETLPESMLIKILATDISTRALTKAVKGQYTDIPANAINPFYLQKYFSKLGSTYTVNEDLKNMITFRVFNLMDDFPFQNKFDIIFCRNVMIYFDNDVQQKLISKFYDILTVGGLLFIGHSESLSYKKHKFKYVEPTVYMK